MSKDLSITFILGSRTILTIIKLRFDKQLQQKGNCLNTIGCPPIDRLKLKPSDQVKAKKHNKGIRMLRG